MPEVMGRMLEEGGVEEVGLKQSHSILLTPLWLGLVLEQEGVLLQLQHILKGL